MKILYIATSFPTHEKGATIYTDLAEALFEAGHSITVAVAEQPKILSKTQLKLERGFEVLRVVTGNFYDVGLFEKGITMLIMPFLMRQCVLNIFKDREFDFILFESPPVTNTILVSWLKKKFECPAYLMLKDIFPQNAVDIDIMKKNSLIFHFFRHMEKKLYRTADIIGCMSDANKHYILRENQFIDNKKVEIFPNTKKITENYIFKGNEMRRLYNIPDEACLFIFGGNMGKPQFVELLVYAINECKDDKDIFFAFVGRGTERYKLEAVIENSKIPNAIVIENLPRDKYETFTAECDVGLIVLDPRFTIPNYPSRILSYLEYGIPVLAATDRISDLRELLEQAQCGHWVCSDDKDSFVDHVRRFADDKFRFKMGCNGRQYLEKHLTIDLCVQKLEKHFT